VAVIDVAGYVADLKDHAVGHGFHIHDERHFLETYSLRQTWEVDLHPEEGCGGPVDLHLSLEVEPRTLLAFEDVVNGLAEGDPAPEGFHFLLTFTWALPPLEHGPDLLVLATQLAGVGGAELPLEVSAIDSFPSVTDAPERSLGVVARQDGVSLHRLGRPHAAVDDRAGVAVAGLGDERRGGRRLLVPGTAGRHLGDPPCGELGEVGARAVGACHESDFGLGQPRQGDFHVVGGCQRLGEGRRPDQHEVAHGHQPPVVVGTLVGQHVAVRLVEHLELRPAELG